MAKETTEKKLYDLLATRDYDNFQALDSRTGKTPVDPETGASIRQYYGSLFGQNTRGMIHDAIWGSTMVPEYAMAVIFPM